MAVRVRIGQPFYNSGSCFVNAVSISDVGEESPMTRPYCVWVIALAVGLALGQAAHGAVLCKKKSGAVVARDACKSKETALDLRQIDGGGGPGGGGEPSDSTTDHTSGSRLRVRYLAGADGSREFIGFFDNQRNENCLFGGGSIRASDGAIRCLPSDAVSFQATFYFADAACKERLAAALKSECFPKYAAIYSSSQCPKTETIYPVLSSWSGSPVYYVNASAQCVVYPGSLTSYNLYTVGDEIAPSTFVQASGLTE